MAQNRADGTMTQQMRIRYFVMNLIYHNTGKSVKVPSTRELAKRFGIARSTIQLAFEQLIKEGYLVCRQGAATMTNPLSHFVLQPETRNPLIGVKLYELLARNLLRGNRTDRTRIQHPSAHERRNHAGKHRPRSS